VAGPVPAAPFKHLTTLLAEHFETPPWQGEFPEVVPHLTVGLAGEAGDSSLSEAAKDLASKLPLRCRAGKVDVMVGGRRRLDRRLPGLVPGLTASGSRAPERLGGLVVARLV